MATASPTPAGAGSHFTSLGRRTSARQALRRPSSRPALSRSESNPLSAPGASEARETNRAASQPQQYSTMADSSDDEIPVPMKLSALTKALLGDGHASEASSAAPERPISPPQRPASRVMTRRSVMAASGGEVARETRRHVRAGSASAQQMNSSRPSSPVRSNASSSPVPRKRVVRLSHQQPVASNILQQGGSLPSRHRRSLSTSTNARPKRPESRERTDEKKEVLPAPEQARSRQPSEQREMPLDVNTPVLPVRTVRIVVGSSGKRHHSGASSGHRSASGHHSDAEQHHSQLEDPATVGRAPPGIAQGSVSRFGQSVKKDEAAPASSMRSMKRVSKIPGSFLSGPARRGRRRQSEEDAEAEAEAVGSHERESQQHQPGSQGGEYQASSFYAPNYHDFAATGSPVSAKDSARAAAVRKQSPPQDAERENGNLLESGKAHLDLPSYKALSPAAQPVNLPSTHDKENEIPLPTSFFKSSLAALGSDQIKPLRPLSVDIQPKPLAHHASPDRKALAPRSQNTPHRQAPPPPPKMSVVETATKAAGAAQSKKRSVLFRVNDRMYTRIDLVGRGGSGKVYRVSAENGSMLALKRVSLENADETTVKGFKGEIDLLKRLNGVERVIQLIDWELNNEKQMLSVLMEVGELDLNTLIKSRIGPEGHKLDTVFVKFYWKEMLECLAAVHAMHIVHSDLKPANFVLVKGRLKLIDFGIANAIQTDETVNVHRENQIGTPNYMSPESLMDSNQYAFTSAHNGRFSVPPPLHSGGHHAKKLMKLGKPSDVWSLGCILYQMVYGDPPFAHIPNQMARCQAIINWNHAIEFPERAGTVRVPPGLVRTMRRCLDREQKERPTCEELLSPSDPFLYPLEFDPETFGSGEGKALPVTEELLGRIIQSVVQRCRERLPTNGEAMSAWPSAYWASVRKNVGA